MPSAILIAPKGKMRVLEVDLLDSEDHAALVGDYDNPEEAFKFAEDYNDSRTGWGKEYVCRVYDDQGRHIQGHWNVGQEVN